MRLNFSIQSGQLVVTNIDGGPDQVMGKFGKLDRVRLVEFIKQSISRGWDKSVMSSSSMYKAMENGWPDADPEDFVLSCIREAGR